MNSEQQNTELLQEIKDDSGLLEIQQAMEEIKKLKNEPQPEQTEETVEEIPEEKPVNEDESEEILQKKENKENKQWQIKRDKYRALAEKEAVMQENAQLKQMLSESLNSGTYHYGKNAYSDLERAKENKKKALEDGDISALIESDIVLNKAINTINDLERWTYNEEQKKSNVLESDSEFNQGQYNLVQQEMAADWLENHSYLQPSSPNYNHDFAGKVAEFINTLDKDLADNGQMNAYFSELYFETIENYINHIKTDSQKSPKNLESTAHVGSVRNSYSGSINGKTSAPTKMILTADEKKMCANGGISEKDWLRYKLEDLKGDK